MDAAAELFEAVVTEAKDRGVLVDISEDPHDMFLTVAVGTAIGRLYLYQSRLYWASDILLRQIPPGEPIPAMPTPEDVSYLDLLELMSKVFGA